MYLVLKNDKAIDVALKAARARAGLYQKIRTFFAVRNVLEVETPLLAKHTIPDPQIPSIEARYQPDINQPAKKYYLQTSPEFAMKRLLASGFPSIYQICKAFRNDFCGRQHNPEFSMLEWYRVAFDHHDLMQEVDLFFQHILQAHPADKKTYQNIFIEQLALDPLTASINELKQCAVSHNLNVSEALSGIDDKDMWLNLLMSHLIEPQLGKRAPLLLYNYPASQAALAKLDEEDPRIAQRFEVFYQGKELANGFCELNSSQVQRERFEYYQQQSQQLGLIVHALDEDFLHALDHMPACAGVAIGLDRLLMLKLGIDDIKAVLNDYFE